MKFRLLLMVLGWRLAWLAGRRRDFSEQLENRDVVMQWRTFEGDVARWFHFRPGRVDSRRGVHPSPSVTLNFKDADYAFRALQASGKNQMAFMEGMQAGDIKVDGDPAHLMWFMTLMKYIAPGNRKA